jgi:hypothetical protein
MKAYGAVNVLTSALVGAGWSAPCRGRFTPGNRALIPTGYTQNRPGRRGEKKNLAATGTQTPDSSAVQPVAIRYIDCAIPVGFIASGGASYISDL